MTSYQRQEGKGRDWDVLGHTEKHEEHSSTEGNRSDDGYDPTRIHQCVFSLLLVLRLTSARRARRSKPSRRER
jgi:hypothetical protein